MRKILMLLLVVFSGTASADFALSYGVDIIHDEGAPYTELRYIETDDLFFSEEDYAFGWSAFLGTDNTFGGEFYYPYKNWEVGVGVEYSDAVVDVVETEWKYQFRVGYNFTESLSLQVFHKSNCRDVCTKLPLDFLPHGPQDKSNKGFNYLSLMYRW